MKEKKKKGRNGREERREERKRANRNHCVWTVEFAWLKLFIQTTVSFIFWMFATAEWKSK